MPLKLTLVVRTDLDMGRGKIAAQVAHAAVIATLANRDSPDLLAWIDQGQPKVVLRVRTAKSLLEVAQAGRHAGLPVSVVHDAGRTQVEPGTSTCCAIGPAEGSRIDAVTGGLSLL